MIPPRDDEAKMKTSIVACVAAATVLALALARVSIARAADPSKQVATIPLPGVQGRFDHFAFDVGGKRLFVAALGNNTVEVIDVAAGKATGRIKDLPTPQGIAFAPDLNRIAVANDKDGSVRLFDGKTLAPLHTVELKDDADNIRYDPAARRFWAGYGDGGLAAIDAQSGKLLADIKLEAHPESFQLESKGKRIFVNVTRARHVAVIDREKAAIVAKWPVNEAEANFPMALDEADHRLFIGCRNPAKLLVLDSETGKTVASVAIAGDTDDLFYDAANKRIYVSGGEGRVTIIDQADADNYKSTSQISTAPGARTSFFVPKSGMLFVAVPHRGAQAAELRVFKVESAR
jgi:DNA-binding beta-propeller fold protein YncE